MWPSLIQLSSTYKFSTRPINNKSISFENYNSSTFYNGQKC